MNTEPQKPSVSLDSRVNPIAPNVLIEALIEVESGGRDDVVTANGNSVGCLQVTDICLLDINRILRLQVQMPFTQEKRFNRRDSIHMLHIYLSHYATEDRLGRTPTLEDMARIWNGGPNGWKKPETEKYWVKVRDVLLRKSGLINHYGSRNSQNWHIDGIALNAPTIANKPIVYNPTPGINPGDHVSDPVRNGQGSIKTGREMATGQFNSRAWREAEERNAWDNYVSATLATIDFTKGVSITPLIAEFADVMLSERRKRFPVGGAL